MKTSKILILLLTVVMSTALYAQNDSTVVCIWLYASGTTINKDLWIVQNANFKADTQESDEGSYQQGQEPKNVGIWAIADYGNMSTLKTNNIVGTKLGFLTNNKNTAYELRFKIYKGKILYLKDNVTGKEFPCTVTYPFTAEAGKKTVTDRFVFVTPSSPQPTEYEICYSNGYLRISNYPTDKNTNHIVVRDENNNVVKDKNGKDLDVEPQVYQEIDLRHLTAGHYTIEANGETLTIGVK